MSADPRCCAEEIGLLRNDNRSMSGFVDELDWIAERHPRGTDNEKDEVSSSFRWKQGRIDPSMFFCYLHAGATRVDLLERTMERYPPTQDRDSGGGF